MNTKNNKRRQDSKARIENAFIKLMKEKELNKITVSEICKLAPCNRSTFYANYLDIYDIADSVRKKLEDNYSEMFEKSEKSYSNYLELFRHIKENMEIYKLYFKLGYDKEFTIIRYDKQLAEQQFGKDNNMIDYHCEFFRGGITMIIKLWLESDCAESPEDIYQVIVDEYKGRNVNLK